MNWAMAMLPLAVSVGSKLKRWKTKPILWRRNLERAASLSSVRALPSTSTLPREACATPPITYNSEDLPQPEGPITTTDSPGSTSRFTPREARKKSRPPDVAQTHAGQDTEATERRRFRQQRTNDEPPACPQRLEHSDVPRPLHHRGVHGQENHEQPDRNGQRDHCVNERLQAGHLRAR